MICVHAEVEKNLKNVIEEKGYTIKKEFLCNELWSNSAWEKLQVRHFC